MPIRVEFTFPISQRRDITCSLVSLRVNLQIICLARRSHRLKKDGYFPIAHDLHQQKTCYHFKVNIQSRALVECVITGWHHSKLRCKSGHFTVTKQSRFTRCMAFTQIDHSEIPSGQDQLFGWTKKWNYCMGRYSCLWWFIWHKMPKVRQRIILKRNEASTENGWGNSKMLLLDCTSFIKIL